MDKELRELIDDLILAGRQIAHIEDGRRKHVETGRIKEQYVKDIKSLLAERITGEDISKVMQEWSINHKDGNLYVWLKGHDYGYDGEDISTDLFIKYLATELRKRLGVETEEEAQ